MAGKRYEYRTEKVTEITVYSNQKEVSLYNNGKHVATRSGEHVFKFKLPMEETNRLEVRAGEFKDSAVIYKTDKVRPEYKLKKVIEFYFCENIKVTKNKNLNNDKMFAFF